MERTQRYKFDEVWRSAMAFLSEESAKSLENAIVAYQKSDIMPPAGALEPAAMGLFIIIRDRIDCRKARNAKARAARLAGKKRAAVVARVAGERRREVARKNSATAVGNRVKTTDVPLGRHDALSNQSLGNDSHVVGAVAADGNAPTDAPRLSRFERRIIDRCMGKPRRQWKPVSK